MALTVPSFQEQAFHCPHCGVYAHQIWQSMYHNIGGANFGITEGLKRAVCAHCGNYSLWIGRHMIYPDKLVVWPPNADMNEDIQADYREAASIVNKSPRGAAALLRLCIQKLCQQLGEPGKNLNDDIASLVSKGLQPKVQQSLDIVRVIGNNAVHPGQIDLKDDEATALNLFTLVNLIAEAMISQPKHVDDLYASLPEEERLRIKKRDKPKE